MLDIDPTPPTKSCIKRIRRDISMMLEGFEIFYEMRW